MFCYGLSHVVLNTLTANGKTQPIVSLSSFNIRPEFSLVVYDALTRHDFEYKGSIGGLQNRNALRPQWAKVVSDWPARTSRVTLVVLLHKTARRVSSFRTDLSTTQGMNETNFIIQNKPCPESI